MGFFMDELLSNRNLTARLLAYNSSDNYDINGNKYKFLGVAPLSTIEIGWDNIFNSYSSLTGSGSDLLSKVLNNIKGWSSDVNTISNMLFSNGFDASSLFNDIYKNGNIDKLLTTLQTSHFESPTQYNKMYGGTTVGLPIDQLNLIYVHGLEIPGLSDGGMNVKSALKTLLSYTIGGFSTEKDALNELTNGASMVSQNLLGIQNPPNDYTYVNGFYDSPQPGTFTVSFGGKDADTKLIENCLVTTVNISTSPILTTDDDYYYAIATVGIQSATKLTDKNISNWLGIEE